MIVDIASSKDMTLNIHNRIVPFYSNSFILSKHHKIVFAS